ncbi:Fc receptor-like protein 5 [Carassius carassius]|uniref:Fc receptor-like protein 5 n=1 Tax=Carassius carassius TaxID=217509 RepID=UPI0028689779|nr:Fc receptor-like protein 5 [Carassius carassius]
MSIFTILDEKDGYWQIKLDEPSSKLCTFNTPWGRYRFLRLPFGIKSASEVFQQKNCKTFSDIQGGHIIADDMIIAATSQQEHDDILAKVMERAKAANVRFNGDKIQFMISTVKYMGHIISPEGLRPDEAKVKAIMDMPPPEDKQGLQRLLGMTKYLAQYIPNEASITAPLRQLLRKDAVWQWDPHNDAALERLKSALTQAPVLRFYDHKKPLTIQANSSKDGLGACLLQEGHPVCYASRALTDTEQRYAQIEKELLAILFAARKFHHYIYGEPVMVQSDHKPLENIMQKQQCKAPATLQRMLLQLQKYDLNIAYTPGKHMYIADTLSRATASKEVDEAGDLYDEKVVHGLEATDALSPQTLQQLKEATAADQVLQDLCEKVKSGWPQKRRSVNINLHGYWALRHKISIQNDIVMVGDKINIPHTFKKVILEKLHKAHQGVQRTKAKARKSLYWPGMARDIEMMVEKCAPCQQLQPQQQKETLIRHDVPELPWLKVGVDIFELRDFTTPTLIVLPQSSLFTGDSVTLRCEVDHSWDGWEFLWTKNSNTESTEASTKTIDSVKVSDGGEYRCRARRGGHYTRHSEAVTVIIYERPKLKVSIKPARHVFRGETVTLRCDIDGEGVTSWQYSWYKDDSNSVFNGLQEHTFSSVTESDAGKYSCYGAERGGPRTSNISDEVTLTVSDRLQAVLSVSPQKWLTEEDPVTLICEVYGSSTDWTFSWFTLTASSESSNNYQLLSDSSRGAGGNYTVSSAALKHTGVYVCRAERGKPAYKTTYSNTQPVWVTGVSPLVSLIISPSRTQHFTSVSLSLSCEDQSNSDRWRVRRYTESKQLEDCSSSVWGSQTGSTCTISSTITSDTGVYWCQSQSGENSHPVNITVHSGVILESPVHPVTEGDTLTLRCLYQHSTPPNLRADFYKDGSLIQNQTTEMIISTVSKSHEGFYYCKHSERGESPKSWISVRERPKAKVTIKPTQHVFRRETVTLRCDTYSEGVTSWQYSWYKDDSNSVFSELQEHTFSSVTESDAGKYSCYGAERGGLRRSQNSDAVTLTVSELRAVLSVSPQKWLTEGDPVTLICEVNNFSTDWTFTWYTVTISSDYSSHHYQMLSDSSRGAGGNYTVSSAALKHTGVYVCRAERIKPAYYKTISNTQPVWVTGCSPRVSLIISPSRTQHFTSVSLSLSCEDQSNSDRWRVRRYTESWGLQDCSSSVWGSQTGSTCTIRSTITSDTGLYWCQSQSGENSHPVNITVHFFVILESPVHPVTEGDTLTLRCLYQHSTPPNLRADFYKDGSLIQNQTTEMIISTVSKSHEGFYYCKHSERGESLKSWISCLLQNLRSLSSTHSVLFWQFVHIC